MFSSVHVVLNLDSCTFFNLLPPASNHLSVRRHDVLKDESYIYFFNYKPEPLLIVLFKYWGNALIQKRWNQYSLHLTHNLWWVHPTFAASNQTLWCQTLENHPRCGERIIGSEPKMITIGPKQITILFLYLWFGYVILNFLEARMFKWRYCLILQKYKATCTCIMRVGQFQNWSWTRGRGFIFF